MPGAAFAGQSKPTRPQLKQTQPMRAMPDDDIASAPTLPPTNRAKIDAALDAAKSGETTRPAKPDGEKKRGPLEYGGTA